MSKGFLLVYKMGKITRHFVKMEFFTFRILHYRINFMNKFCVGILEEYRRRASERPEVPWRSSNPRASSFIRAIGGTMIRTKKL